MAGPTEGTHPLDPEERLAVDTGRPVLAETTYQPGSVVPEPGETSAEAAVRTGKPVISATTMHVAGEEEEEGRARITMERAGAAEAIRNTAYCFEGGVETRLN